MINDFGILISHGGQNHSWKDLMIFLKSKYPDIELFELSLQNNNGNTVIEKLSETVCEECNYAIVIMTKEDELKNGKFLARQNVVHELGYCQGVLGRHNVLLILEKGVEKFSNIGGLVYEEFQLNIREVFSKVENHIDEAIELWEDGEDEYGDCDDD